MRLETRNHINKLYVLQACRGFACLMVALYHGEAHLADVYAIKPYIGVYSFGFCGVHLFFVISGFIIFHAHYRDSHHLSNLFIYAIRRIIRIYPLYVIVFMIWGGWRLFTGALPFDDFMSNALFFSSDRKLIIPVAWTLAYEMVFYSIFILFLAPRKWWGIFMGWFILIVLNHIYEFTSIIPLNSMNLLFLIGLSSSVGFRSLKNILPYRRQENLAYLFLLFGGTIFFCTISYCLYLWGDITSIGPPFYVWGNLIITLGFGFASSFVLLSSLSTKIEDFIRKQRFLLMLSNASYPIYLVHGQMQRIIIDATRPIEWIWVARSQTKVYILFLLAMVFSVGSGILIHKIIEKPLLSSLGRLLERANMKRTSHKIQVI